MTDGRVVDVSGVRLAYRRWGPAGEPADRKPPDGEPVVLLHGGTADGTVWTGLAERVAAQRRWYAPDLRGYGGSDRPGRYGLELARDDVLGLLDVLGVARAVLVGHSSGAVVAYLAALAAPARVAGLVLVEPPPPIPLGLRLPPCPDGAPAYDWAAREAVVAQLNAPDPRWWARLAEIDVPVLLVAGGPTSHLPQDQLARMAARFPAGRLVTIAGAGHGVPTSRPDELAAVVRPFLESTTRELNDS